MTPEERKSLAEQLLSNSLYEEIMTSIEDNAKETLIYADTEQARVEAQWRVRAARAFRADCEALARNTQPRKGAPV